MNILGHFRKHNIPHPNCIVRKSGAIEHYLPADKTSADTTITTPTTNPTNLMGSQTGKIITWSIENSSGDIPDTEKEAMGFALGITQWGLRLGVTFKRVNASQNPNIPIMFLKPGDPNYAVLFPDDDILAVTYYPVSANGNYAGHMYFNNDFRMIWTLDGKAMPCSQAVASGHATGCTDPNEPLQTYKITRVGRHEFGHALGMQHMPASPNDTMYPYYNNADDLGPDEIALAQSVYGIRNPPVEESYLNSIKTIVANES